ncbi:gephyrin-like molybdotransferase Glp [Roseovarius sp. 2305UL8-3]|uniref:molybdenum cofactor synthesis domain-containing protein n=1 Tax=Roseovarius conchicola TaxID=3121636 RepID=UPI003527EAFD
MIDWSGGNDTGPTPRKDAIWMGVVRAGHEDPPLYLRNRMEAEQAICDLIDTELAAGRRLAIGFDFPFGYPQGFARELTGSDDPLQLWDWLEARIEDAPNANNRFDLAASINAMFPGTGPFWFNGLHRDIPGLTRKDTRAGHGMRERRACEEQTKGAFTCWQLGGAGAVGGQVLTGLPVLARLRRRYPDHIAVWPFQPLDTPVALIEIWPGLINASVKRAEAQGGIRDAHQVQLLARALSGLSPDAMKRLLTVDAPEEGWIMGLGHEDILESAITDPLKPPPLRDDCFALPAGVDWTPVDDALALLRTRLRPVVGQSEHGLEQALGRVLAAPLIAQRSNPPQANSAVDGYGFAFSSIGSGDQVVPLVEGRSAAGVPYPGNVPAGHAIRILTGAAVPEGVDTVILQEDVTLGDGEIAFREGVKPGANTREAGEDVAAGQPILEPGRVLTPADLALAAATGLSRVTTYEPLKVAILSTGDEIKEPGQEAGEGQIYDANRPMLAAMVRQFGYEPVDMGIVPDNRETLRQTLDRAAHEADLILTSGGASSGDEDHVSALLTEAGAMAEWRIALKPGRPLALGVWNGTPVFGLPGNPVAALVCTLIFARPAMHLLAGAGWRAPQGFTLPAAFRKNKKPGRREYLRARIREGRVEVFASEGSGRISGLSWADGLVEIGDEAQQITPGDPVHYIPFSSFL